MVASSRYARQIAFAEIGADGQDRLARARVAVLGLGGLGSVSATLLARAGVGFIRIVDRDRPEPENLHRQLLYTEADAAAGIPKAEAAARALRAGNSLVTVEPVVADIGGASIESLIRDVDLVLDGSDNFALRYIVNDACVKLGIPWVYGGAVMAEGVTMTIVPGSTPCLRCLQPEPPDPSRLPSAARNGVLAMAPGVVANIQALQAIKLILGITPDRGSLLMLDIWGLSFALTAVERNPECPCCGARRFDFLADPADPGLPAAEGGDARQA